ncbi:MAG: vitamin K epoxide reductase [Anaerolineales bacterium]|nr:vitamin K epoxide reductase [Anaerolineales bacterium]
MKRNTIVTALLIIFLIFPHAIVHAQTDQPIVHAVLFYSPTCGHCEFVIEQTILPMMEEYGTQLQVIGIDVTTQEGRALFLSALQTFNLEQAGVPFLVVDDMYLIGSGDIPEQFPSLVESYLAQGGVDFPNIAGLAEVPNRSTGEGSSTTQTQPQNVDEAPQAALVPETESPASSPLMETPNTQFVESHNTHWTDRFAQDPAGNVLSVIVLIGMLISLIWVILFFSNKQTASSKSRSAWIIPLLSMIGFGVAGYLAYVETTHTSAVCGPVGDCNTVQQSEYARLFGILPIGILGLFGYVAIFISWLITRYGNKRIASFASLAIFLLPLSGMLFSVYLTFLEPFVIGATCAWCLTSAILMTILTLLTVGSAKAAFYKNEFHRTHNRSKAVE